MLELSAEDVARRWKAGLEGGDSSASPSKRRAKNLRWDLNCFHIPSFRYRVSNNTSIYSQELTSQQDCLD